MSVVLASASRLKAEVRLAQAISQFEADLSREQKAAFRASKIRTHKSPPTPSDVMRVAAEIDHTASGKVGGGRCFGPRFTNVLHAVQQFAALGDIIIGDSQRLIACGVWSVVRMTLLFIVTSTSYLEKLSVLFMAVGHSAPRYQMMGLLYVKSKSLQSSLSEYFIVVVRLCHHMLNLMQRSIIGQFVSSLDDSHIKGFQSELDSWANAIKEEVVLSMGQTIEDEGQENSRFRALSTKFSKTASHRARMKMNLRVLDLCSTYDYETTWKQTRKRGNATLFNNSNAHQNWKNGAESCTLVYRGKLGSGKSVLLANVVEDLNLHFQNTNIGLAYFFCRHDILESLKARTVIGSLARQLLSSIPDLSIVGDLCESSPTLDIEAISKVLRRALPRNYNYYFVLDGLYECSGLERAMVEQELRTLQAAFTLNLCISSRIEADDGSREGYKHFATPSIISLPDDNPDIEGFISAELESCIMSRKLQIGDPGLIIEIEDALLRGAQGMFLWVALQIESLCAEKTDKAIRQALEDLPMGLSETYSRILAKSLHFAESYQARILKLLTIAQRPLTIEELREALSVNPGDPNWNTGVLLNDLYSTLTHCGSLVIVDEEEMTVRLVHHSAKNFLLRNAKDSSSPPRHSPDFTEALSGELLAVEAMSVAAIDDNYNQIIFGSESDAASAESSSVFSSEESRTTAPSTLPSALIPISKEGSEQDIPPMSFYNYTTLTQHDDMDPDFDVKSVASVDTDLFSTVGSDSSSSALRAAAEDYLVKNLTDDEELLALYQEATLRLDEARFVRNHTRLLKIYFLDIQSEEQTPAEKLAIRFLRSRSERVRISRKIRQVLMPTDSTLREKINVLLSQKTDTLYLLSRHLEERDSALSPAVGTQDVQLSDADNSDAISESSSIDSNNDNENLDQAASEEDLTLFKLESVVSFLTTGRPFKSYKENLRNFLLPNSDPAVLQNIAERVDEHLNAGDCSTDVDVIVKNLDLSYENPKAMSESEAHSLTHPSYRSIKDTNNEPHPSENNFKLLRFLSNLYQFFLVQCLAIAEDVGLYERILGRGFVRLTWDCSCGCCFSQDYPASRLAAAQSVQFKLIDAGYQARMFAWSLDVPDVPVTLNTSNDNKQQHIELPKTPSLSHSHQHIGTSTVTTDTQSSASGQAAQDSRSGIHLRTGFDHEQNLVKTEDCQSQSITSSNTKWLLLCFYHDKYVSKAVHMDIGEDLCDEELLSCVKKEYITARGWTTYNLSWTAVSNIRFVRFFLIREDNNSSFEYDVEDNSDEGRENEEENAAESDLADLALLHEEWRPPAEWNERDAWAPCPGDERPESHAKWVMHLWNKPHSSSIWLSSMRLQQLCKAKLKLSWTAFNWKRKGKLLWINFRIFRGMSHSPSTSAESASNNRDDIESRVVEIPLPPSQQLRARQQGARIQKKGRFFVQNTPKRLEQRLKADLTTPPYGWGLSFEESFVVPVFFKVLISLLVFSIATTVVVVCINFARKKGYQIFGVGSFTLAVASITLTVIFKFLV